MHIELLCQKVEIEQYIKNGQVKITNVYQSQVERFYWDFDLYLLMLNTVVRVSSKNEPFEI